MEAARLRFTHSRHDDLLLQPGVHAIGRIGDGVDAIGLLDHEPAESAPEPIVNFCVDRRGVWLTVAAGARGVHVNGRRVLRMAMLRLGDAVYVDGVEMLLVSTRAADPLPDALQDGAQDGAAIDTRDDPRVVLRSVGGQHHGRSFTLQVPRLVGRARDADIRIDDPSFAERHARLELIGDTIVLRDLGSAAGSLVNGLAVRDAILQPGDQVVFDAQHRYVVEAPLPAAQRSGGLPAPDEDGDVHGVLPRRPGSGNLRRLPWLLLAALLMAAALGALLLFGSH